MYKGKKVVVCFSTYNEKDSLKEYIDGCFATGLVDDVVVVNNNAAAGSSEEVAKTRAIEVHEHKQWYWWWYRRAIQESLDIGWDLIILTEPDGTFSPKDVEKFLVYSEDFPVVFGTRTTSSCIGDGANMWFFIKWGNWAVAKMVEVLFNTTHLSDVWCTYKLFHKDVLNQIKGKFTVWASHFWPELMLLVIKNKIRFVEIPVLYLQRVWVSSVTWDRWKTIKLWMRMIWFILHHRFVNHDK